MLGDVFAAIGDQPVQLHDLGAKRLAFHHVGRGRVRGHHDDRRNPRSRGVRCERAASIACRWSRQSLRPELLGARYRRRHPTRLERTRGVQPLILDIQPLQPLASTTYGSAKPPCVYQRRHAFAQ